MSFSIFNCWQIKWCTIIYMHISKNLIEYILDKTNVKSGQTILDPFAGSGVALSWTASCWRAPFPLCCCFATGRWERLTTASSATALAAAASAAAAICWNCCSSFP